MNEPVRKFQLPKLTLRMALGMLLTLPVVAYLAYKALQGVGELSTLQVRFQPGFLALSLLCQTVGVLLAAWVWSDILRQFGVVSSYLLDLQTFCVSALARKLPGFVWHAIGRMFIYQQVNQSRSVVLAALATETVMISLGGLVVFALGILFGMRLFTVFSPLVTVLLAGVLALLLAWAGPRLAVAGLRWLARKRGLTLPDRLRIPYPVALRWLVAESAVVALGAGVLYFVVHAIQAQAPVPLATVMGGWGVSVFLGPAAMWLPADLGLKDGIAYLTLAPVLGGSLAALSALTWRLWVSLMETVFGVVLGIGLGRRLGVFKTNAALQGKVYDRTAPLE